MITYAQTSCTLSTITDVTAVYTYYYLASSVITSNMAPKDNINPPDETHDPGERTVTVIYQGENYVWYDIDPTLDIAGGQAVGQLYYIECVKFSDGSYDWGPLMTSSTYAAAKAAYNLSSQALAAATSASSAVALLGGHFVYKSSTSTSQKTPPSANVIEVDDSDPTKWKHNVHIGSNGIRLRYNEIPLADLSMGESTSGSSTTYDPHLMFYAPKISSTTHAPIDGDKAMELTTNGISFYQIGTNGVAASLTNGGLNIQEGTIQLGNIAFDQSGNVSGAGMYVNNNGELYIGDAEHYINLKNTGTSEAPDWKISLISDEIYFGNNQKVFNLLEDGLTGLSNQINGQQVYAYSTQPTSTRQVVYEGQTEYVTIIEELIPLTTVLSTGATAYQRSFQLGFKDSGSTSITSYNDTLANFLENYNPASSTALTTILTDDETDEIIAYPIYTYDVMEYRQSTDTEVDEDKTYYTRSGDESNYTYTKVNTPTGNPSTMQYYELGIPWVCTEDYIVYGENYTPYCYTYQAYIKPKIIDGNTIINDSCEIVGSIDSDGYTQLFLAEQYVAAQETSIPTPKPAYYIYDQTDNTYTIIEDEDIPDNANPNALGWYKDNPDVAMFTNFTTETTDNIVYLEQTLVDYFNSSTQNLNDDNTVNFTVLNEHSAISQEKNEPYLTKNLIEMPDIINVTKTDASISYLSSLRIYMDSAKLSLQHGTEDIAYIVEETGNYNEAFDDYEDALNLKNLNIHNQIYFGNLIIQNDEGGLTIRRGGSDGSQT